MQSISYTKQYPPLILERCLIGTFEGKSENDFIKEISGKVYVKAGTDSVDVINLQTRRTKRYKVQYT